MKKFLSAFSLIVVAVFVLAACGPKPTPTPTPGPTPVPTSTASDEPYEITGGFTVTNGFVFENYFVENAVALVDMHGFVTRDNYWELPVASQVLGFLNVDVPNLTGTYQLSLPERPLGVFNDVDNNGNTDTGVQIFAVSYFPNFASGPYSEGDDKTFGWPSYLASVKTDAAKDYEVTGGKLVVWAPDGNQEFPTGFGADVKLFTADDPVAPIAAGWTIVDLDQSPFAFVKEAVPQLTLYEPADFAVKDYSNLSYTESFDKLIEFLRTHYAFNGYSDIQPNWDALVTKFKPLIQQAETNKDPKAFWTALNDFTWAFKDGHVGMSDPNDYYTDLFTQATAGGYGFAIRELDDGRTVVIYVLDSGPAATAGMKVGAVVTEFNGKPIKDAIGEVTPWTLPQSSDLDIRYQQARYLLRTTLGTEATVTFTNPGGAAQTVTLKAIAERNSFSRTSVYFNVDTSPTLPVEYSILDSGVGYVKINSYSDDLNLTFRLFKRAMDDFTANSVPGIIIDLRYNSGGNPIGLAGFLTNQDIPMPQGYSYSEATGKFEKNGVPGRIIPNVEQYSFDKMVVLVGPGCASACEDEAYSFSKVPGMIVVGMFPTQGTMADVGDGQISMPDGISMQFPTERFILDDGSLFLQGTGVQPTLRVPITEENVVSTEDVVLQYGERAVLLPLGAGITPASQPTLLSQSDTQSVVSSAKQFEDLAREKYTNDDNLKVPNTFTFTIPLSKSQTLLWAWGWCAKDQATLDSNLSKIDVKFTLNGQDVPLEQFLRMDYDSQDGQKCMAYLLGVKDWAGGQHKAVTILNFKAPLNDGKYDFPVGQQVFEYNIYVKP
jgi:C-terminal processing protease CtpA/Prc